MTLHVTGVALEDFEHKNLDILETILYKIYCDIIFKAATSMCSYDWSNSDSYCTYNPFHAGQ